MRTAPAETGTHTAALDALRANVSRVIKGKTDVIEVALTALLAGGHLLLEDVPGVGKTTLALSLSRSLGCTMRRVQFTSDLLPSDILGTSIYRQDTAVFEFIEGPVFSNILLADEINRATPKTQGALLEAMNERQVSIEGQTRDLPRPFMVIATQNPHEYFGTYPLPESQLDRFLLRTSMGYPARDDERTILQAGDLRAELDDLPAVVETDVLLALQAARREVFIDASVIDYILDIVESTRNHPPVVLGVSTRGALALKEACQARAMLGGRAYVTPDDVKAMAVPALAHRLQLSGEESAAQAEELVRAILEEIPVPR